MATKIPRSKDNDYTRQMADERRRFAAEKSGAALEHVGGYSFDPAVLPGNVENFIGVAQVPIGLAGPLRINGEHAQGDFATVVEQFMQRSPAFVFDDARKARDFGDWVREHFDEIKAVAQSTTRSGRLVNIGQYPIGPLRNLRFNYTTGDAAGQNMTGKATRAACEWIKKSYPGGNMDTDKKHSRANMLLTRGKRVVAECTIKAELIKSLMHTSARDLFWNRQISNAGAFLAGSANNGAHAANGLTAMFIATGQDVANISESHAGVTYAQLLDNGDYYWSITLTSLIVATYGGGTGLPTQREGLELLGCYGAGKADKFAEICAAVVLAGDTSLSSAILADEWVSSHDEMGRNRP